MNESSYEGWSTPQGLAREAWIRQKSNGLDSGSSTLSTTAERTGWALLEPARTAIRNDKLELARILLERLVASYRDSWKNPISRASALNELAYVVALQGDAARAERLYLKTQKIWLSLSPLACPADGKRLFAYALFLHDYKLFLKRGVNRSKEAQSLQNKLEVLGIVFSTGSLIIHIADANALRGRFREARLGYEQAFRSATIEQDEKLKGTLMQRLSLSLSRRSESREQAPLVESIGAHYASLKETLLPERKATVEDFTPDGVEVLWQSYLETAQTCAEQSRLTESETYFRKALQLARSVLCASDATSMLCQTHLAIAHFYAKHPGKRLEAEDSFKRALIIAQGNSDGESVATISAHLEKFYADYGRTLESQSLMAIQGSVPPSQMQNQSCSSRHMRLPKIPLDGN